MATYPIIRDHFSKIQLSKESWEDFSWFLPHPSSSKTFGCDLMMWTKTSVLFLSTMIQQKNYHEIAGLMWLKSRGLKKQHQPTTPAITIVPRAHRPAEFISCKTVSDPELSHRTQQPSLQLSTVGFKWHMTIILFIQHWFYNGSTFPIKNPSNFFWTTAMNSSTGIRGFRNKTVGS